MEDPSLFSNNSKKICTYSLLVIILVIAFIVSPLKYLFKTALFMKIIALIILFYTIKLSIYQFSNLRNYSVSNELKTLLYTNLIFNGIYIIILLVLFLFISKSIVKF